MQLIGGLVFVVLAILSLRGVLWAYVAFVLLGLLYFPARVGFDLNPTACELAVDARLALLSLTNYPHIVLFAIFFVMTCCQLRGSGGTTFAWAGVITVSMGILVELAEGIAGRGHCRLRDLVPDTAGALVGAGIVAARAGLRRRALRS
jgi:hypothetical protein